MAAQQQPPASTIPSSGQQHQVSPQRLLPGRLPKEFLQHSACCDVAVQRSGQPALAAGQQGNTAQHLQHHQVPGRSEHTQR